MVETSLRLDDPDMWYSKEGDFISRQVSADCL